MTLVTVFCEVRVEQPESLAQCLLRLARVGQLSEGDGGERVEHRGVPFRRFELFLRGGRLGLLDAGDGWRLDALRRRLGRSTLLRVPLSLIPPLGVQLAGGIEPCDRLHQNADLLARALELLQEVLLSLVLDVVVVGAEFHLFVGIRLLRARGILRVPHRRGDARERSREERHDGRGLTALHAAAVLLLSLELTHELRARVRRERERPRLHLGFELTHFVGDGLLELLHGGAERPRPFLLRHDGFPHAVDEASVADVENPRGELVGNFELHLPGRLRSSWDGCCVAPLLVWRLVLCAHVERRSGDPR